jgi:hypothetical protein
MPTNELGVMLGHRAFASMHGLERVSTQSGSAAALGSVARKARDAARSWRWGEVTKDA